MLEEAAYELFLEQGYDGTTVAEIARRAGVSRGTFFNYFPAKADVFWGDIDEALDALPVALRQAPQQGTVEARQATLSLGDAISVVDQAILEIASTFGPDRVPWLLTQHETMGRPTEVGASILARMGRAAGVLCQFFAEVTGDPLGTADHRAAAYTALARTLAGAQDWADAGPTRGSLAPHVDRALRLGETPATSL